MPTNPHLPTELAGALPVARFLDAVTAAAEPLGFTPARTLPAVAICRDELTQHLAGEVSRRYAAPFALGGLGGVPVLGRTGWGACLSHVPDEEGRGRLLVICLPHLGVDAEGVPGRSLRPGQAAATTTCGALGALLAGWDELGSIGTDTAGDDPEVAVLARLVSAELPSRPADIVDITRATAAAALAETSRQLEAIAPWDRMDAAVFTGIQLHVAGEEDRILPLEAAHWAGDGIRRPLEVS